MVKEISTEITAIKLAFPISPAPVQLPSSPHTPKKVRPLSSPKPKRKESSDSADTLVVQYMERVSYSVGNV